jgi:hypothetical protein
VYTVPAPPVPPETLCTLTTGVSTASNGTINIGSRPPGVEEVTPLPEGSSSPAPRLPAHPVDKAGSPSAP